MVSVVSVFFPLLCFISFEFKRKDGGNLFLFNLFCHIFVKPAEMQ